MTRDKVLKLLAVCLVCVGMITGAVYLVEWLTR